MIAAAPSGDSGKIDRIHPEIEACFTCDEPGHFKPDCPQSGMKLSQKVERRQDYEGGNLPWQVKRTRDLHNGVTLAKIEYLKTFTKPLDASREMAVTAMMQHDNGNPHELFVVYPRKPGYSHERKRGL